MRIPFSIRNALLILALCFVSRSSLFAQEQTISQMVRTSWTGRDGAPQGINALAQTPDGILWIGSFGGLFTFDGLKFRAFTPTSGSPLLSGSNIGFFSVSKNGDLWAFPFHGPPARVHNEEVRLYDHVRGEPLHLLLHPQQDSNGTLWAVLNERHLVRFGTDGIWEQVADPVPATSHISNLSIDSRDTMWVIDNGQLYRKPKGQIGFSPVGVDVHGMAFMAGGYDNSLWVAEAKAGPVKLQHIDPNGKRLYAPQVQGPVSDLMSTPDGSLWIAKPEGLQRLSSDEIPTGRSNFGGFKPDLYPSGDISKNFNSEALLTDFDGNIWVGGGGGLTRFEHADLMPALPGSKLGLWHSCVDKEGVVWIASANGNVQLISGKSGHTIAVQNGLASSNLFCGDDGHLYLLSDRGISVARNGRTLPLPLLSEMGRYVDDYSFLGLIAERHGDLIAAVGGPAGHGLWKYSAGRWSRFLPDLAVPEICGMLEDAKGRLYLALADSKDVVGRINAGSLTLLTGMGALGFARTNSYGIVAYGRRGVAIDRENHFQKLSFVHPEQGSKITGVVEAHNGDLWLNGAKGIVRIPSAEIRAALKNPSHEVVSYNLQEGDFVGPDVPLFFRNSAHIDPTGRLWFSTLNGVVSVDPDHLAPPRHPPLLSIRSITADGHPLGSSGSFPPDTQYLDVQYFGVDLTRPQNVVYRYRLQGLDTDWQNVGSRTDAIYTHLRPGDYTFQVMASSGNDVWTLPISSSKFTILPHFYETRSFQFLCALIGVLIVWVGFALRLRYVSAAIRMRAEERIEERIRIARELHDTLLQGVQGLLLSFHVAASKVPPAHESKESLNKALKTADRILLEGRDRVNRLRSEHLIDTQLEPAIRELADSLAALSKMEFTLEKRGKPQALNPEVLDEVYSITREALTNAYRHSGGSQIVVALDYESDSFRLECRDNGKGFANQEFEQFETDGHWGLRGISERAERIGADLKFESVRGEGVRVTVSVPAARAYLHGVGFRSFFRRVSSS